MQNLNVMVFEIVLESAQWALLEAEHSSTVYSTFISTVLQFSSGKSTCSYFKSSVAVNHLASHFPMAGTLGSSLSWQPLMQLSCFFLQTDRLKLNSLGLAAGDSSPPALDICSKPEPAGGGGLVLLCTSTLQIKIPM